VNVSFAAIDALPRWTLRHMRGFGAKPSITREHVMSISTNMESGLERAQTDRGAPREVKVWDAPTRVFHWLLVAMVGVAWLSSEEEGFAFLVHTWAGYTILAALIFRLAWGFIGGAYARFSSFLRSPATTLSYVRQFVALKPPHFIGHNPLGGWMVVALVAVLALIVMSGLFAKGEEGLAGVWAGSAIGLSAHDWYEVHELMFNLLLALIGLHIVGVIVDQLLSRDNLIRAMITGNKRVSAQEPTLSAATVGVMRAVAVALMALIATGYLVGWQLPGGDGRDADATVQQREAQEGRLMKHEEHEHHDDEDGDDD
jgi:cytochrome b